MNVINVLDAQSANMIAAGEVVERPAAAVKELAENAIDAGATAVSVEIKDGGNTFIRVSDNGVGMSADDLPKALLRHATSKIKSGADIDGVLTLGFRGEALAAISAVSRMSVISRYRGTQLGNLLTAEGEGVTVEEVGCPEGTTVLVEDLFYNTPARRKFMKKDVTEAAACRAAVEKLAVSHPNVAFRFTSEGELKFATTGDGSLKNAIADTFGDGFAKGLIEVTGNAEDVQLHGYVSTPEAARGRNNAVNVFVNNRYVVSKTVAAAIKEAFKSYIPHDRYPAAVLFLTLPPKTVDVNVHPAKIEVKFTNERAVYEAVYYGIRTALQRGDAFTGGEDDIFVRGGDIAPKAKLDSTPTPAPTKGSYTPPVVQETGLRQSAAIFNAADFVPTEAELQGVLLDIPPSARQQSTEELQVAAPSVKHALQTEEKPEKSETTENTKQAELVADLPVHRYVGEAWNAYIMAETPDALYIIDKHAAHERILYEQLRQSTTAQSQALLTPVIVELDAEEATLLVEEREYLYTLGFDIDLFGDKSVALRAVPAALNSETQLAPLLQQFAASLAAGGALPFKERVDRALFTMACKAAVKAGVRNTEEDNKWIIDRLFKDGTIKYCPHGRPVAKVIPRREADKWFDR